MSAPRKNACEHLIYNPPKTETNIPSSFHNGVLSNGEFNVLPVSVLRKPLNSCVHCLASAVCFDGSLTDWTKQKSFYCPKLHHCFLFLHSQELAVTEFNNVKGTTHAKIDVTKELAVFAFLVGCSSARSHHVIAD